MTTINQRILITFVLYVLFLGLGVCKYFYTPSPPPIRVIAPTEQSIQEDLKHELLQRRYKSAILAAKQVYKRSGCGTNLSETTGRIAVEYGLSARVLAALVFVESSCRPDAVSGRNSIGLAQINPFIWKYPKTQLLNPEFNLRLGAQILSSYIHKYGLIEGLHRYNGLGNKTDSYSKKVLTTAGIQLS